jgi:hypothetical protein
LDSLSFHCTSEFHVHAALLQRRRNGNWGFELKSSVTQGALPLTPQKESIGISGKYAEGERGEKPEELKRRRPGMGFDEVIDSVVHQKEAPAKVEDTVQPENAPATLAKQELGARKLVFAAALEEADQCVRPHFFG